jgi:hypothetical protein
VKVLNPPKAPSTEEKVATAETGAGDEGAAQ